MRRIDETQYPLAAAKNTHGFGLVHAMMIVGIIGGISYFIMDALNLNNQILQNVSSAKVIDDVVEDIYNRLKDPEMCAVDYYVTKEYDDYSAYAKHFNRRLYQNDISVFPRATQPTPGVTEVEGRFYGFGNFFWKDSATASQRIPFLLNRRGVEEYRSTDSVAYQRSLDLNGKDVYNYATRVLNYGTIVPFPAIPDDDEVAYWALPDSTPLDSIVKGAFDEKYLIGGKVAIKDMYLQNYNYDSTLDIGSMDLVIIFVKNVNQIDKEDDNPTGAGPQATLGGRLTRRVIKLNVSRFSTPTGVADTANSYTPTMASNSRIRKCYADKDNYVNKLTRYYCEQNGGSFENGECLGFDAEILRLVRRDICTDMYGAAQWDVATNKCVLPRCKYGITGFDAMGVPQCLCNLGHDSGVTLYKRRDGTVNYRNTSGVYVQGCPP